MYSAFGAIFLLDDQLSLAYCVSTLIYQHALETSWYDRQ